MKAVTVILGSHWSISCDQLIDRFIHRLSSLICLDHTLLFIQADIRLTDRGAPPRRFFLDSICKLENR